MIFNVAAEGETEDKKHVSLHTSETGNTRAPCECDVQPAMVQKWPIHAVSVPAGGNDEENPERTEHAVGGRMVNNDSFKKVVI